MTASAGTSTAPHAAAALPAVPPLVISVPARALPEAACTVLVAHAAAHTAHRKRTHRRRELGAERRNSSTSVVLPMPVSPVMKTSWRTPWRARRRCSWSWFNSVSRPTKRARCAPVDGDPRSIRGARGGDWSARSAVVAGACSQTLAMKRKPRRWAVSMKRGLEASSPRTRRSSPIDCVSVSSTTAASCQTSRWRSALVTRRPGRSTR